MTADDLDDRDARRREKARARQARHRARLREAADRRAEVPAPAPPAPSERLVERCSTCGTLVDVSDPAAESVRVHIVAMCAELVADAGDRAAGRWGL
jgi:hypothetical protein